MQKKNFPGVIFLALLLLGISFYLVKLKGAESASDNFQNIYPFSISTNRVGFFDQTTGRVFIYDDSLKYVAEVLQLEKLGKPFKRLDWRDYLEEKKERD
jgi:hypothetical protein